MELTKSAKREPFVKRTLKVVVLTPAGSDGTGGIARLMDTVREELATSSYPDVHVEFVITRGTGKMSAPLVFARALLRILLLARSGQCDVVHINLASYGSAIRKVVFGSLCERLNVPYIIHLHGAHFHKFWSSRSVSVQRVICRLFERAASTIVLGRFWADLVARNAPIAGSRVVILPNATRRAKALRKGNRPERVHIVFLGKLGKRKGTPELVQALASLKNYGGWYATLAGDGDIDDTRAEVERAGLLSQISVPGWVGKSETEEILRSADILALPSHDENLPMSIVEAFAHGVAVVSTPVGSITDIVEDGRTGLLVPPGNPSALATAFERLITNHSLRESLGRAARQEHEARLELTEYLRRLIAIWENAAEIGASRYR